MQLNHAHCIYIKEEEEVLPAKSFILTGITLISSCQEADFPKVTLSATEALTSLKQMDTKFH